MFNRINYLPAQTESAYMLQRTHAQDHHNSLANIEHTFGRILKVARSLC